MSLQTLPETSLASTTVLRKPESVRVRLNDDDGGCVFPLVEGKTTIGSSPQCTIVLPGADSRPLQCVLAVDENRVEATRWGAGVQLNRRDFTKSVVAVGDRLTIGACEIVFEEAKSSVETTPAATTASPAEIDQPKHEPARVAEPALPAKPTVAATQTVAPAEVVLPTKPAVEPAAVATEAPQPMANAVAPPQLALAAPPKPTPMALLPAPAAVEKPASVETPATSRTTVLNEPPTPSASSKLDKLEAAPTAAPAVAAVEPATVEPLAPSPVDVQPASLTSLAFADQLILQLWQASETSKQRTKNLIAATRDARFRTNAMAADLAAMEVELDLARAAYDSHAADHEQLHLELIERDRRAAERIGPLAAEVERLRSQLQESQVELAEQASRCDQLNAALENAQTEAAAQAHAPTADETHRTAELEQSLTVQIEQATMLARELGQVRTELEGVRAELEQHAARRAELESDLASARGEVDSHQQSLAAAADRDAAAAGLHEQLSSLHAERDELHQRLAGADQETARLAELCQASADRIVALEQSLQHATDSAAIESEPQAALLQTPEQPETFDAAVVETESEHAVDAMPTLDEVAWNVEPEEPSTPVEEAPLVAWDAVTPVDGEAHEAFPTNEPEPATFALVEPALVEPALVEPEAHDPEPESHQPEPSPFAPPTPMATRPVESETAGTSFIDKYRHLLDDDGDAPSAAPSLRMAAPIIDDEFLSPAKAADRTVPADDSDEALDAYMASMMERMRGAATTAVPILEEPIAPVAVAESSPVLDYDPSEPFDIESMKQGRRTPVSTDLAALREIANTSARTAIETHRNRKKVESTLGKMIVALIAAGASAYLMLNAPSLYDWQFGTGIVVAVIGFGAAALAMRHPERHAASHVMAD